MYTYCKNVDPGNPEIIRAAFLKFLAGKSNRNAVTKWLMKFTNFSRKQIKSILRHRGTSEWHDLLNKITNYLAEKINNQQLEFPAITVTTRKDKCSGKYREIGTQSVEQSVIDHVLVLCMQDIFRRLGRNQMASIPGRGCLKGAKRISGWLKDEKGIHYFTKLDVKKCYESIKIKNLLAFIHKYIKNKKLLYVLEAVLQNHKNGLSIGSYLSQWLSNLYMSQIYHFIEDTLYTYRRNKKIRYVRHALFYMDDILLLSTNKKNLQKAIDTIIAYAKTIDLKIVIKVPITDLRVIKNGKKPTIPMLGFRIAAGSLFLSKPIWYHAKRITQRCFDKLKNNQQINVKRARTFIAKFGYLLRGATTLQKKSLCVKYIKIKLTEAISNHAKSKIYRTAATGS